MDEEIIEDNSETGEGQGSSFAADPDSQVAKLKAKITGLETEKSEYLDGWQRQKADFINYKRDVATQLDTSRTKGKQQVILELLPVLESFELALAHSQTNNKDKPNDNGLKQIYSQLRQVLKGEGVLELGTEGEEFDPSLHESVGTKEVAQSTKENIIESVVSKGYRMGDKVLKPAKVIVTSHT